MLPFMVKADNENLIDRADNTSTMKNPVIHMSGWIVAINFIVI